MKEASTVSTKKVKAMVVPWTNFLRKKMSDFLRRTPRPIAKSGFNMVHNLHKILRYGWTTEKTPTTIWAQAG